MLKGKSILVTGGTGSFGQAFVAETLSRFPDIDRLVVFSRDELKQYEMAQIFSDAQYPALRYFIGDVRDVNRLRRALNGIDIVIHAAALKQVPAAEYNPMEFIHTNILGAENIVEASLDAGVERVIALSTDKAVAPINLYGATKLCSDKVFIAANYYSGSSIKLSVVRYGNVMGSRGSVIPYFLKKAQSGVLPITSPDMTRFNIPLQDGIDLVMWAVKNALGSEIFVPKARSYRIVDVAEAIGPGCECDIVGIRPGEKIHEEMITEAESYTTVDCGNFFVVLPSSGQISVDKIINHIGSSAKRVEPGFTYQSGRNGTFLSVDEIRELIERLVDPKFKPI